MRFQNILYKLYYVTSGGFLGAFMMALPIHAQYKSLEELGYWWMLTDQVSLNCQSPFSTQHSVLALKISGREARIVYRAPRPSEAWPKLKIAANGRSQVYYYDHLPIRLQVDWYPQPHGKHRGHLRDDRDASKPTIVYFHCDKPLILPKDSTVKKP